MLHYNFPPFSVGEVEADPRPRPSRNRPRRPGRARARADAAAEADFPYTVRIVSDILESNGSSSMASVCGGVAGDDGRRRADQGAGRRHRDGPRHGRGDRKYAVLTDIVGDEDHYGDMDFKVAGTKDGITALQMDIKVTGISADVMRAALTQAKAGRLHILGIMEEHLPATRTNMSRLRAAHRHHPHPGRQDPRRHRARRQDDPQHHREDRRQDRRRGQTARSTWPRPTKPRRPRRSA